MAKKRRTTKVLYKRPQQPKTRKSLKKDREFQALAPGKRRTPGGKIYYERRQNRSDIASDSIRGHFRIVKGKRVYVKPHRRRRK